MSASRDLHPETRPVHAGTRRSQFGEVSRGDVLIQGFIYDGAEQREACSKGAETGDMSLFPTVGPETKWRS
jgi:hypothetical protein